MPIHLRSLSARLLVPLLVTILVVLGASAWFSVRAIEDHFTGHVLKDVERSAELIERATHDGMLLNRKDQVQTVIERLGQDPTMEAIRIYDKQGVLVMSAEPREIVARSTLEEDLCVVCHAGVEASGIPLSASDRGASSSSPDRQVLRHLSVIANEAACASAGCHVAPREQAKLGVLELEVSMAPLQETLDQSKQRAFWTMVALMIVISLVSAAFVNRVVLRPVARLHEGTDRIAQGELGARIDVHGDHELADLAAAFNAMARDLAVARDELSGWSHKLEANVMKKSEELGRTQRQVVHMEKMASLGKLSATVAHELNNPISSMLTYARLVERELEARTPPSPDARRELIGYLRFLQQECSRCGGIVQNLLLFARNSSGGEMAPTDVNEIVRRSLMLVRHHLEIHDIKQHCKLAPGNASVVADTGQLEQALVALLVNAVESMTDGEQRGGELTVVVHALPDTVEVEIADTGVGIPHEVQDRIFEPFFSTKNAESGVGLGLAVVYAIVQRHSGRIELESAPSKGTTFRIRLPREQQATGDGDERLLAAV